MSKRYNALGGIVAGALLVMVLHVFTNVGNAKSICFIVNCRVKEAPIINSDLHLCGFYISKEETRRVKFSDNSEQYVSPRGTGACYYQNYTLTTECWPQFRTPIYREYNFGAYGDASWEQTVVNQTNGTFSACSLQSDSPQLFIVTRSCSGEQEEDGPEV
jgi:hypothetical protein